MKNKLSKGLSLSVNPKHSISERFKASTRGFCHFLEKFKDEQNTLFSVILGHTLNVILGFIPRIHTKHSSLDTRDRLSVTPEYDNRKNFIKGLDVVRQCAALLERRVQSGTRVRKAQAVTRQTNPIGRSMIEMLGVLAIIGVLSVGGIAGYSKAMMQFKINKTIEQITMIAHNVRTVFINELTYDGLGYIGDKSKAQNLLNLGIITADMFDNDGIIGNDNAPTYVVNPFNGGVWINVNDPGEKEKKFVISYGGLTSEVCTELATKDWNILEVSSLFINGNDADTAGFASDCDDDTDGGLYDDEDALNACPKGKNVPIPVPPHLAAKACSDCKYRSSGCNILLGFSD